MRAMRLLGDGRVALGDVDAPTPGPDRAVVRVAASALCGSEIGALRRGAPAAFVNLGHEAVGTVESVPPGFGFAVGDRVGVSGLRGCNACPSCRAGREMRCREGASAQVEMHAELVAAAPWTLRALPPGADDAVGVLLTGDALGVPARALHQVPSAAGDRVIVVGLGPVGLSHVAVRSHAGAQVTGIEPSPYRRALARELGAVDVVPEDADVPPAPLVIEATGIPSVIQRAFDLVEPGGTLLQSGECGAVEVRPSAHVIHREITYRGTWFYGAEDYPGMVDLHDRGLAIDRLVTHDVAVEDAQDAVTSFLAGETGKVVLRWS